MSNVMLQVATIEPVDGDVYDAHVDAMREREYPMLKSAVYLDHAGTTLYSRKLMEGFAADMIGNLYGNPHSAASSSQRSTQMVDHVRFDLLRYLKADPDLFDLAFVANATAGIKLIADAFREQPGGFNYLYHEDSHTSLVGVRELASQSFLATNDNDTEAWFSDPIGDPNVVALLAYPAQSNMDGRRLPLSWSHRFRTECIHNQSRYTLLDAAALLSTSCLDLSDASRAPDFTVLSIYKIFGFPDLGAVVIRKSVSSMFDRRRYFGGGTVHMVVTSEKETWHMKKPASLHDRLEDGTLAIHSIAAVRTALQTHRDLYQSMEHVSSHTARLAQRLYLGLSSLRHANGLPVVRSYTQPHVDYLDHKRQGPIVAFNLRDDSGRWISTSEVEKLAAIKDIHLRTGGLCNPGGLASALHLEPWELKANFSAGVHCGAEGGVVDGKPTGMIRVSLGAMSTVRDVERFLDFVKEFFVSSQAVANQLSIVDGGTVELVPSSIYVKSVTIYPVKSCSGFDIGSSWDIGAEGLAYDREWCIVHAGTGAVLSQKQYPIMAMLDTSVDRGRGVLNIYHKGASESDSVHITVPLSRDPRQYDSIHRDQTCHTMVCGDKIETLRYVAPQINEQLSHFLGVQCQLARFPPARQRSSIRHSKAHVQRDMLEPKGKLQPILLSNESPILTITQASLDELNRQIVSCGKQPVGAGAFRANLVLARRADSVLDSKHADAYAGAHADVGIEEDAYAEDEWEYFEIQSESPTDADGKTHGKMDGRIDVVAASGNTDVAADISGVDDPGSRARYRFDVLGRCRRCQMVCIDQRTGQRCEEPFVTLAKTRRINITMKRKRDDSEHEDLPSTQSVPPGIESSQSGMVGELGKTRAREMQGVFFGVHSCLAGVVDTEAAASASASDVRYASVRVGDSVRAFRRRRDIPDP